MHIEIPGLLSEFAAIVAFWGPWFCWF